VKDKPDPRAVQPGLFPGEGAPYQRGSDTSLAAAISQVPHLAEKEARILEDVRANGSSTCDEIEVRTGMLRLTIGARVNGLVRKGLLCDSGVRRLTRWGRAAVVWATVNS